MKILILIMSCIGVYATGTCIVAATADDVTYNNTTVSAALNDLYELTQNYCPPGYECRKLKYVTDCDNNKVYTTAPNNLSGLAKIMAVNASLDNGKSEFVTSCNGVDFSSSNNDTNGKGIYEIASTKNDEYPIYYYRGAVDNNNVKFGGFCWKAIRTTDTGGVKMIYNGTPDESGNCTNTTGANTQIGTSKYNINKDSLASVGYMYSAVYNNEKREATNLTTPYVYGNSVSYSNGTYTLTNTMTSTGTWSNDYNTLNNNHYTCFSTDTTCTSVYYIYYTDSLYAYYITLNDGNKIEDIINEMLNEQNVNTLDSTIKTIIDIWYNSNLTSYTNYIEDTVYCNDRSISDYGGWNPNGGDTTKNLYFSPNTRLINNTPSLTCSRKLDRFTVSSSLGNGSLTYPVGLITSDELLYAGIIRKNYGQNDGYTTHYFYTNQMYWGMSPSSFYSPYGSYCKAESSYGYFWESAYISNNYGVRPVISIKSTDVVEFGDGTQTNPYVIKTS